MVPHFCPSLIFSGYEPVGNDVEQAAKPFSENSEICCSQKTPSVIRSVFLHQQNHFKRICFVGRNVNSCNPADICDELGSEIDHNLTLNGSAQRLIF